MGENVVLKLVDLPPRFFVYPDTTNTIFEDGKILYLLPLRSTLRLMRGQEGTEAETPFGTSVIILEGIIMEPVPKVDAFYRRVGRFVVDSLDRIGFFGLLAIPPYPKGDPTKMIVDDMQTLLISLVRGAKSEKCGFSFGFFCSFLFLFLFLLLFALAELCWALDTGSSGNGRSAKEAKDNWGKVERKYMSVLSCLIYLLQE